MPNPPAPIVARSSRCLAQALAALGVAAALGLVLAASWDVRPVYASSSGNGGDSDQDGLPDILERSQGTSPTTDDSDGDGFTDLEELARQSEPRNQLSLPENVDFSVGMTAYGNGGLVHIVIAAYARDGRFGNKTIRVGGVGPTDGQAFSYPFPQLIAQSQTASVPALEGGEILVIDLPVRHSQIIGGYATWYVVMGRRGAPGFASAASVDLMRSRNIVLRGPVQAYNKPSGPTAGLANAQAASSSQAVYQPISAAGGGDPVNGDAGKVCSRTSSTTGSQGGVLDQEVTGSGCEDGWDSHCDGGCADSTGQTYRTVDPMVLVGG